MTALPVGSGVLFLGNFVSNQSPATVNVNYTDTTAILNLELTKDPATGETTVSNINYVPLLVLNRGANVQDRYIILDVNAAIAEYKAGNTTTVSDAVYQKSWNTLWKDATPF